MSTSVDGRERVVLFGSESLQDGRRWRSDLPDARQENLRPVHRARKPERGWYFELLLPVTAKVIL